MSVAPGIRALGGHTGASRAIVDSNDVKTAAALTFSELMQARGASVDVMMSGGRLVDGGRFMIRGPSTMLTAGAPMLIVDGMRMAEQEDDSAGTSSRLDDIAITDIAKVEVLRGPSAAALYGAGASSGVIVVTTKRGHAGRLTAHVRAATELRRDVRTYLDRFRRSALNGSPYGCSLSSEDQGICVPGQLERWNPVTESGILRNGVGANAAFDVAGGTRLQDVRLSGTARQATGITRGDELSQLTGRLNATQRVGRWFEVTANGAYYGSNTLGSFAGEVIQAVPAQATGATPVDKFRDWAAFRLDSNALHANTYHLTTGADVAIRPASWVTLRAATTRDHVKLRAERSLANPPFGDGQYFSSTAVARSSSWNTHRADRATAEVRIPMPSRTQLVVDLVAGSEREWRRRSSAASSGFFANDTLAPRAHRDYATDAMFAIGRVTFADRLSLDAGVRKEREASLDDVYASYPVGGASLRLPLKVLGAEPRVHAAYGESAQRYATSTQMLPYGQRFTFDNQGTAVSLSLPSERMTEREAGVDVDWGGRGGIAFTVYRRKITNLFFLASPASIAELASKGFEVDAHAAIVDRTSLRWDLRAVVATNRNYVTARSEYPGYGPLVLPGYPLGLVERRDFTYHDASGDGVIQIGELEGATGKTWPGGSTPRLSLALHSTVELGRRFTLTGVVDRRSGAWAESNYIKTQCALPEISCRALQDPTTPLEEQATEYANLIFQSARVFDASFTRLREVSLRWTVGAGRWISRGREMHVVLSGRDLATWTKWPGLDPEINSNARSLLTRNDAAAVPLPRRFTLGIEFD